MSHYPVNRRARHWEEFGLFVGLALILLNWLALVVPWLSGPVFHPVLIVVGVLLCYACAMALGGVSRDLTERDY